MNKDRKKILFQSIALLAGIVIAGIKFYGYWITHSNAILSDALESLINISTGAIALYTIWWGMQPRDKQHPYGHGKAEYLSVGIEGTLIIIAGIYAAYRGLNGLLGHKTPVENIPEGIGLTLFGAIINLLLAWLLVSNGKKLNSPAMEADGKHLLSDVLTSLPLFIGLGFMYFTGLQWPDDVLALLIGGVLVREGILLIRKFLKGVLDEADFNTLQEIIQILTDHRKDQWIDLHNLRVIRYGSYLHIDAHLSLPRYFDLQKTHEEMKEVEEILNKHFDKRVEIFIHPDPCVDEQCSICQVHGCPIRTAAFKQKVHWDLDKLIQNKKHIF
ncbi:MAG: cation transporter [Bacteroidia bacterium]|nr:MAG: cation transporter [Bacteroidia bacterium]